MWSLASHPGTQCRGEKIMANGHGTSRPLKIIDGGNKGAHRATGNRGGGGGEDTKGVWGGECGGVARSMDDPRGISLSFARARSSPITGGS